jgi:hypothetical protein
MDAKKFKEEFCRSDLAFKKEEVKKEVKRDKYGREIKDKGDEKSRSSMSSDRDNSSLAPSMLVDNMLDGKNRASMAQENE